MDTASIPLPGTLRLRPLRPLVDPDGSCRRVFDLERAAEVEVPPELHLHLASALESGDFDEPLLDWLVREGLITSETWALAPAPGGEPAAPAAAESLRLDDAVHARLDPTWEEELSDALDAVFAETAAGGAARIVFHLACGGAFPGASALERTVLEAERRAHATGFEILYELALAPPAVSTGLVRFLTETPLHLRLAAEVPGGAGCGRDDWAAAEEAARRVLAAIPERLTFQAFLPPGTRLRDLVRWAEGLRLLHLDAVPLAAHPDGAREGDIAAYREDLLQLAARLAGELALDRQPLDLQPLTAAARRLLAGCAAPDAGGFRGAEAEGAAELVRRLSGPCVDAALRRLAETARAPLDPFPHAALPWQGLALA